MARGIGAIGTREGLLSRVGPDMECEGRGRHQDLPTICTLVGGSGTQLPGRVQGASLA